MDTSLGTVEDLGAVFEETLHEESLPDPVEEAPSIVEEFTRGLKDYRAHIPGRRLVNSRAVPYLQAILNVFDRELPEEYLGDPFFLETQELPDIPELLREAYQGRGLSSLTENIVSKYQVETQRAMEEMDADIAMSVMRKSSRLRNLASEFSSAAVQNRASAADTGGRLMFEYLLPRLCASPTYIPDNLEEDFFV